MNSKLQQYIETYILPRYDCFDDAHKSNHANKVISESLLLASDYDVQEDMVYTIAAYHDLGLEIDRKTHHLESGRILRDDTALCEWFDQHQIETMAQAVEDHRASTDHEPRSIYGRIVAEADRDINVEVIIRRTIQYGMAHYPELDRSQQIQRTHQHLQEKYGPNGYLKLWIPGSKNERNLHQLWELMEDPSSIDGIVNEIYDRVQAEE